MFNFLYVASDGQKYNRQAEYSRLLAVHDMFCIF